MLSDCEVCSWVTPPWDQGCSVCAEGFFVNDLGSCEACFDGCKTCYTYEFCEVCYEDTPLTNWNSTVCSGSCNNGFGFDPADNICTPCVDNCDDC
jgi:hypothetical protein